MKKFYFVFGLLLLIQPYAFSQTGWSLQQSGTTENLNKVSYYNANISIIVGNKGTILYTSNGGSKWENQISGTNQNLHDVKFINSTNILVVGDSGCVLRTSNGGTTWEKLSIGTKQSLFSLSFLNSKIGVAVGGGVDSTIILKTTNSGINWELKVVDIQNWFAPRYAYYQDSSHIIVLGVSYGTIAEIISSDSGKTWIEKDLNSLIPSGSFTGAFFTNSQAGIYTGWTSMTSQIYL